MVRLNGEQARVDHRLGLAIAGQRVVDAAFRKRDRVADLHVDKVLKPRDQVSDLADAKLGQRLLDGMARAHFLGQDVLARRHEAQALAFLHRAVDDADERHDAAVRVEVAVEDERTQRGVRVAGWRGNVVDHGLEQVVHADASFSRGEHRVVCGDRKRVLYFSANALGVGRGQVDLVDKRDDLEVRVHRHHGVRDCLRLNALGRVDHEHRALAGSQRAAYLVGEVDVAGGVDKVELVFLAIVGLIVHAHGLAFDRDTALALDVHRVEELGLHIALGDGARHLEDAVRKRRFPVVDMGDDGEVPDMRGVGHDDR